MGKESDGGGSGAEAGFRAHEGLATRAGAEVTCDMCSAPTVPPSQCDGSFKNGEDPAPTCRCGRDTCKFHSRPARPVLGFPAWCVLREWVGTQPVPGLTLAARRCVYFFLFHAGGRCLAVWCSRQPLGFRSPSDRPDLCPQANSLCFCLHICGMGRVTAFHTGWW